MNVKELKDTLNNLLKEGFLEEKDEILISGIGNNLCGFLSGAVLPHVTPKNANVKKVAMCFCKQDWYK